MAEVQTVETRLGVPTYESNLKGAYLISSNSSFIAILDFSLLLPL